MDWLIEIGEAIRDLTIDLARKKRWRAVMIIVASLFFILGVLFLFAWNTVENSSEILLYLGSASLIISIVTLLGAILWRTRKNSSPPSSSNEGAV